MKATNPTSAWEVGSDFDASSVWCLPNGRRRAQDQITDGLVASGRQAISAVAASARDLGCDTVLFPAHFCQSMLEPFQRLGMRVQFVPVTNEWHLAPPEVSPEPSRTLVYSMSFFGVPESAHWVKYIGDLRRAGAWVLSDETHRALGRSRIDADWSLASLRKMLPVPDGAFLFGEVGPHTPDPGTQGKVRWQAMGVKADQVAAGGHRDYLNLFHASEELTQEEHAPSAASDITSGLWPILDIGRMAAAREANARALEDALSGARIRITTAAAPVPSHHVLRGRHAGALRSFLIARRVYTPVHWPRPKSWDGAWREDILSIPVDHRYSPQDMRRVAELIHEYERGEY